MSEPYWKNEREWVCPKHLPSVKLPANVMHCFFSGCSSKRPSGRPGNAVCKKVGSVMTPPDLTRKKTKAVQTEEAKEENLCAWFKCDKGPNGSRAKVRLNSKYCSRDCSNRNARWRHKQRKK